MWELDPYAVILMLTLIPLMFVLGYAWPRRQHRVVRYFLITFVFVLGNVIGYTGELLSATEQGIMLWARLTYPFHMSLVFWLIFVLAYVGYDHLITKRLIATLLIIPVITCVAVWTNDWHQLVWVNPGTQVVDGFVYFAATGKGWLFYVYLFYLYGLIATGSLIFLHRMVLSNKFFRKQILVLLIGIAVPWLTILFDNSPLNPAPVLDSEVFGIALATIIYAIAMFRYRLLDIVPTAYHRMLASIGNGVIVCDVDLRLIEVNQAAAALVSETLHRDLLGLSLSEVLPDVGAWALKAREQPGPHMAEFEFTQDHEVRSFEVQLLSLNDGRRQEWVVVLHDITARKQMERDQLQLAVERERVHILENFLADISHDLRTPLAAVTSAISLMTMRRTDLETKLRSNPDLSHEDILQFIKYMKGKEDHVERSIWRISYLVDQMIEMTRLDQKQSYTMALTSVTPMVQAALAQFTALCQHKQLILKSDCEPSLPDIVCDEGEIKRAINCLLDNACQYTQPGGSVSVHVHQDQDDLVIALQDTGIGIAPEHQEHIFERLYRADGARRMNTGGSGLGLPIARSIVEAHQGKLIFASNPSEGSTFTIRLPIQPVSASPAG